MELKAGHWAVTDLYRCDRRCRALTATRRQCLPDQNPTPAPLADVLQQRLDAEFGREVSLLEGARLMELQYTRQDGRLVVRAVVRTPAQIGPWQVARMEEQLRKAVDPAIDLVVSSAVGTDATAASYVSDVKEAEAHAQLSPQPVNLPSVRFESGTAQVGSDALASLSEAARVLRNQGSAGRSPRACGASPLGQQRG